MTAEVPDSADLYIAENVLNCREGFWFASIFSMFNLSENSKGLSVRDLAEEVRV